MNSEHPSNNEMKLLRTDAFIYMPWPSIEDTGRLGVDFHDHISLRLALFLFVDYHGFQIATLSIFLLNFSYDGGQVEVVLILS